MMLRESSENGKKNLSLEAVTNTDGLGSGVPQGDIFIQLVDATLGGDQTMLEAARQAVIEEFGREGLVDAAGVIGTFTMQNRVADATGLPLDTPIEMATRSLRTELGLDHYAAAAYTARGGWGRALLARLAEPVLPFLLRLVGRWKKRQKRAASA